MASNQRIDDLITEKAFQQLDRLLEKLGIAVSRFDDMSRSATQANNAVANSQGFRQLNTTVPQAATNLTNMAAAEQQVVTATRAVEAETANVVTVLNQFGGTLDQNVRRQVELKRELAGVRQQLKDLERQYAGSSASQARLAQTTSGLTRREVELKEALRQNSVAIRQQLRDNLAAGSSSDQLAARLDSLRRVYRSLSAEERANAQVGGVLRTSIAETNAQITQLDARQGVYNRNVGNYLRSAFGGLRQLAYILPGIGIAGIFNLIFEGIGSVVSQLTKSERPLDTFVQKFKSLGEAAKSSDFTDAVKNVNELRIEIDLAQKGLLKKDEVLKRYNDTIGKTTGFVNSLNEAESALAKNAENYIRFTFLKAAAQATLSSAAQKASEDAQKNLEDQKTLEEDVIEAAKDGNSAFLNNERLTAIQRKQISKDAAGSLAKTEGLRIANTKNQQQREQKDLLTIANDFYKQAAELASKNKFSFFGNNQPGKAENNISDRLAIQKELLQSVLGRETSSYDERIKAIENFETKSNAIIAEGEKNKNLTRIQAQKLRLEIENQANEDTFKVNKAAADKAISALREYGKLIDSGLNDRLKAQKAVGDQELADLAKNTQEQLTILAERYRKGELSEEQYQSERLNITGKYDELVLQSQIDNIKKLNSIRDDDTNEDAERNKQAADLEIRLNKLINDRKIANDEKYAQTRLRLLKQVRDAEFKLGEELIELGETLVNASFERANQELESRSEQLNINKENELEAVERSVGSEEEKQGRIALINEKYAQQQAALEKKQSEIRIRQAKFEKAFRTLQVAINTFQKVAEIQAIAAVLLANPFTAALAPIALAQIPFVIGSGAAQAAAILAAPIPAYKDGVRNKSYGSLSIYGEAGQEYVKEPGKQGYFTSGATLGYLPAGTDVISNKELMAAMAKPEAVQYVGGQKVDLSQLTGEMRLTRKAIQGQKINTTVITKKGAVRQQQRIDQVNAYKASRFK